MSSKAGGYRSALMAHARLTGNAASERRPRFGIAHAPLKIKIAFATNRVGTTHARQHPSVGVVDQNLGSCLYAQHLNAERPHPLQTKLPWLILPLASLLLHIRPWA